MRIAFINNFFTPRISGSARQTEELALRCARKGHDVLVVTTAARGAPGTEERDGFKIVRLPSFTPPPSKFSYGSDVPWAGSPGNLRRMFKTLDDFGPDVIHQHGQFFDLTFLSSIYVARRNVPVVLTPHTRLEHPDKFADFVYRAGDRMLVKFFIDRSTPHFIVMDQTFDEYVRERYGATDDRISIVNLGVDPNEFFDVKGERIRERHGLGDRPVILSIGHVIPVRDRVTIVEAMPALLKKCPDACLLIVGEILDESFVAAKERLGLTDEHVLAVGPMPYREIPEYVGAADIEVHDTDGHGMGNANLEVMGAAVPSIVGVEPDIFMKVEMESWGNIVLVKPRDVAELADAMAKLLTDEVTASNIGLASRRLILDYFTWDRIIAEHEAVYQKAIAQAS